MSKIIERASQFPKAPYYVIGTDTFMSGWGPAEGKTNVVVLPCVHSAEANIVRANAEARSEMKHVRIVSAPPALSPTVVHSVMTRKDAARWYQPNGFTVEPEAEYNGWKNWATWAVNLHLSNDESSYRQARMISAGPNPAETLRKFTKGQLMLPGSLLDQEFANCRGKFDDVAWQAIVDGMNE